MHVISALLFSLCANIDNLPIGIAYGLRNIKIPQKYTIFISLIISVGTYLFMSMGDLIIYFLTVHVATMLACGLLVILGCGFVYRSLIAIQDNEEFKVQPMNFNQCLFLSATLMINNAGVGITAKIAGAPVFITAVCTFLASWLFLSLGTWISHHCMNLYSSRLTGILSGVLMILLGIWELLI